MLSSALRSEGRPHAGSRPLGVSCSVVPGLPRAAGSWRGPFSPGAPEPVAPQPPCCAHPALVRRPAARWPCSPPRRGPTSGSAAEPVVFPGCTALRVRGSCALGCLHATPAARKPEQGPHGRRALPRAGPCPAFFKNRKTPANSSSFYLVPRIKEIREAKPRTTQRTPGAGSSCRNNGLAKLRSEGRVPCRAGSDPARPLPHTRWPRGASVRQTRSPCLVRGWVTFAPSTSTFGPHGSQRTHTDEDDGAPRTPMLGAPQGPRFDASVLSRSLTRPPQKRNRQFTDSMSQAESRGRVPKPRPPPQSATRAASPRVPVCRFGRPPRGGALMSSHARKPRGARGAPSRRGSCNRVRGSGAGGRKS